MRELKFRYWEPRKKEMVYPGGLCINCDSPTGKVGDGEDSIFAGGVGPLCEDCFAGVKQAMDNHSADANKMVETLRLIWKELNNEQVAEVALMFTASVRNQSAGTYPFEPPRWTVDLLDGNGLRHVKSLEDGKRLAQEEFIKYLMCKVEVKP